MALRRTRTEILRWHSGARGHQGNLDSPSCRGESYRDGNRERPRQSLKLPRLPSTSGGAARNQCRANRPDRRCCKVIVNIERTARLSVGKKNGQRASVDRRYSLAGWRGGRGSPRPVRRWAPDGLRDSARADRPTSVGDPGLHHAPPRRNSITQSRPGCSPTFVVPGD